jgi:RNA polymerase sigma factor (sigma-70 family)
MTSPSRHSDPDAFLAELPWLRRLALRLTGNTHDAEDLAQQAWLQASEGRRPEGPVRGWLAAIARNLHRATHRAERRRAARQSAVPQPENGPSPDEMAARLDAHRSLLAAVHELAEPYRSTVTQHYLYGQSVRAIAEQSGVSPRTVETRLRRGREQLRGRLDREFGSRGAWLGLFAPLPVVPPFALPDAPSSTIPAPTGAVAAGATLTVTAKTLTTAAAGLAAIATLAVLFWGGSDLSPELVEATERTEPAIVAAELPEPPETTDTLERTDVVATPSDIESDPQPDASATESEVVPILCLDVLGRPVSGLVLQCREDGVVTGLGTSDPRGRLDVEQVQGHRVEGTVELAADRPGNAGRVLVVRPRLSWHSDSTARIAVVARTVRLAGVVRSAVGDELREARLDVVLPEDWQSRIPHVLDAGDVPTWRREITGEGRFELLAPLVPGAMLRAIAAAHQPVELQVPEADRGDLDVVLDPVQQHWSLSGVVVDGDGEPMSEAFVVSDLGTATADDSGRFLLEVNAESPPSELRAIRAGFQPASLDVPSAPPGSSEITGLRLALTEPSLAIRGRVLDGNGDPLVQGKVWYERGTPLGWSGDFPVEAERQAAGVVLMWHHVLTDDSGHFEITGLLDREYTIRAACSRTMQETQTRSPVRAGSDDVELRLDPALVRAPVRGVVVDSAGQPVSEVGIMAQRVSYILRSRDGMAYQSSIRSPMIRTDEAGAFVLEDLAVDQQIELSFGMKGFSGGVVELTPGEDPGPLRVVLHRQCIVSVDLGDPERGDAVSFQGPDGAPMTVARVTTDVTYVTPRPGLTDGRVTVKVSGNAVTATLWKDGVEVSRMPVQLADGEPVTLRF